MHRHHATWVLASEWLSWRVCPTEYDLAREIAAIHQPVRLHALAGGKHAVHLTTRHLVQALEGNVMHKHAAASSRRRAHVAVELLAVEQRPHVVQQAVAQGCLVDVTHDSHATRNE